MSRPKDPPHRRRARMKHGTKSAYTQHIKEPEIFGPPCEACTLAWRAYSSERRALNRARRERLRYLLVHNIDDKLHASDVRPLTTQELDIAVRMIRILDEQLLERRPS